MRLLPIVMIACAFGFAVSEAQAGGGLKDVGDFGNSGRCVGGAFAGPYAGVHVGFGSLRSNDSLGDFGGLVSGSDNDRGFSIGGHTGYNIQCGRVLFGVETDFNYFGADTSSNLALLGFPTQLFTGSSMDWYGTLRGRLGLVSNDTFLIYATGGLAYADVDHSLFDPSAPGGAFSGSRGGTQWGWTAGGGIEFMRYENWSIRAEALYVDLGSESEQFSVSTTCETCTTRVDYDDSFWVARVGLTYHFHRDQPAPYVPLK